MWGAPRGAAIVLQVEAGERIGLVVERPLELRRAEQLIDRGRGKGPERSELHAHGVDRLANRRRARDRIIMASDSLGEDDVGVLIAGEALRIDTERTGRRGR